MNFDLFERVVLRRDLQDEDLRSGDVGVVVELYGDEGLEVEFMSASGDTQAVVTLDVGDVRRASADDMLAVRPMRAAS